MSDVEWHSVALAPIVLIHGTESLIADRAVQRLRALVLGVDPTIAEGIKWNAPSWRTAEYFATTQLRAKRGIGLVLHLGARARSVPAGGLAIDDPDGLLVWRAPDRALLTFADRAELEARVEAVQAVLRQWIAWV